MLNKRKKKAVFYLNPALNKMINRFLHDSITRLQKKDGVGKIQ